MQLTRRSFMNKRAVDGGIFNAAVISARGSEALDAESWFDPLNPSPPAPGPEVIRIDSNENPLGPGRTAMEALLRAFEDAGRYPSNSRPSSSDLRATLARKLSIRPENVVLGAGSREILRNAVRVFTSPARHLVTAAPSYENPERLAEHIGVPVRRIPVDEQGCIDRSGMAEAARWSGLVFFCNPNNPTSTVHGAKAVAEFVGQVRRESPETAILIDEAYHDYVTDPGYATALPLALEFPNVFVTRTLSKAYGMAGLRIGYAVGQVRTIETLARWAMPFNQNALGLAAAVASLADQPHIDAERARNLEVRKFTTSFFKGAGLKVWDSQTNFLLVEIKRPSKEFRDACAREKVLVGRDFPPLDQAHTRISLGTMEEMKRATDVFSRILGIKYAGATSPSRVTPDR